MTLNISMSSLDSIIIFHLVFSITREAGRQSRGVVGRRLPTRNQRGAQGTWSQMAPPRSRVKPTPVLSSGCRCCSGLRGVSTGQWGGWRERRVHAPESQRKAGPSPTLEPRHTPPGPQQPLQGPHRDFVRSIYRWGTVNPSEDGFPQITCRECVSAAAGQPDLLQGLLLLGAPLTPAAFQVTQKMGRSNTPK